MGVRVSRIEQKQNTRRGLIQAATRLFAENGITCTATADIAKSLRVSHGTVFIHFPTREDLILAVIDDFGARLADEFGKTVKAELGLKGVLRAHLNVLSEFEDFYFHLITEMQALPPRVKSMVFMLNAAVSWKLYEASKPLSKTGQIKKIEQRWLFNTWMALVNYHVAHRDLFCDRSPILTEKSEELVRVFYSLIKT